MNKYGNIKKEDSLETQKGGLLEIIKKDPNWTLYRIYEDQDSGGNTSRPGFQSMIWDSYDNRLLMML